MCCTSFYNRAPDIEYEDRIISDIGLALSKNGLSQIECAFTIDTKNATIQVPFHKILYFETSPTVHKVILHTTEEQIEFYGQLSKVVKQDCRLYKCHKSFVVNPENIVRLDKELGVIYFENGEDSYYYCFKDEGCHIIYHRFMPEDYWDLFSDNIE